MNLNLEKVIILIIIGTVIVTSAYSLNALSNPVTKEEAIEISKDSELVKEGMATARGFMIVAHYYNSSELELMRKWHSDEIFKNTSRDAFWEEWVLQGHTAWEVIWWFGEGAPSEAYAVIVIVDAEMGAIVREVEGIHLL